MKVEEEEEEDGYIGNDGRKGDRKGLLFFQKKKLRVMQRGTTK